MDSFEANKVFASILIACLIIMVSSMIGNHMIHPVKLEKSVVHIAVQEIPTPTASQVNEEIIEPVDTLLASANIENGKKLAKQCIQCHTFEKGGPHRIGPNLWNIIGGKHAHAEGFAYSSALQEMHGQIWTIENINNFIYKPRGYISRTKMTFAGLKKTQERADLIAYLQTLKD